MRNRKKHIVAYREDFQEMYFSKDNFLIPYYIAKESGGDLTYFFTENKGNTPVPSEYRGVRVVQTKQHNRAWAMLKCIVLNARGIDILFLNGSSLIHMAVVWMYQMLNTNGKVVVFGDMERPQAERFNATNFECIGASAAFKRPFVNYFMNHVTYLVANTEAYVQMKQLCDRNKWSALLHFYPLLDDEKCKEFGIVRKSWEEKENVIVCVGRIGNYQKNTEMLLDALKNVDLKDWKIYMIGPVTSSFNLNEKGGFQKTIDKFFADYPEYKERLIFTGMIYDQQEMMEYYNRAKVLLSTARHEGFANVFSQAAAMGCYIISTDVGGADVASNNWQYGTMLQQEDSEGLSHVLANLVNNRLSIDTTKAWSMEEMSYSNKVRTALLPKMQ